MDPADTRNRGLQTIKLAAAFDNDGKWAEAVRHYMQGIEYLMHSSKYEKNERTKTMLTQKITEYLQRAEGLKAMLADGQSAPPKVAPPGGGGAGGTPNVKKPDAKGAGKKGDSESDKMKEGLSDAIQMETPDVPWDAVAGLETAKAALKEAVIMPVKYPQLFRGERKPWRGILMYGPPGTGKSYLAKALATEAESTFFSVSSADLVSKWVGESEKLVRSLFELAREHKPSIIFIDEIDSLCTTRSDSESESARRIKTEFLVQMDGVGKDQTGVLLLGATNLPWGIDQAVRRRFEKRIYIPLPDTLARKEMFRILTRKQDHCTMTDEDYQTYAERTEGFSGSDLKVVVREALMEPVRTLTLATHFKRVSGQDIDGNMHDDLLQKCEPGEQGAVAMRFEEVPPDKLAEPPLTPNDFETVIGGARSSVSAEDLIPFEKWTAQYGQDGSGASGQRGITDADDFAASDPAASLVGEGVSETVEGAAVGGGGGGGGVSRSEGLGYLLAQLATHLPAAMRVTELEARVVELERQLGAAGGGGGAGGGTPRGGPMEGEPPADAIAMLPPAVGGGA